MPFPSIHPLFERALIGQGYTELTSVQEAVLTPEAEGRDLLVSAQTGSGKTVAYGLALAHTLLGADEKLPAPGAPLALIIAPTRELAMQVQRELIWLYGPAGARIAACIGGMDPRREARALEDGCHIVVGTPGRLRDHIERGRLDISTLRAVTLDEADEMLDLGFREDIEFILDATPAERRTLLFSATFRATSRHLPADIRPTPSASTQSTAPSPMWTSNIARSALRRTKSSTRSSTCCASWRRAARSSSARRARRCATFMRVSSNAASQPLRFRAKFTQGERTHALQALRDGRARVCVATDVAARGIDLPGLELVIHADCRTIATPCFIAADAPDAPAARAFAFCSFPTRAAARRKD